MSESTRAYYAGFGEREWTRLTNPDTDGPIEFAATCRALAMYLPDGARVLDLGGGPGRYTIWLAEHGQRVVLADRSAELLAIARERIAASDAAERVEEVVEADARDLRRWPDISFDAVVCMGPFYHLPDSVDRDRAAEELRRVLRPGGIAFVTLMPRYALLRRTLSIPDERRHLADAAFIARLLNEGAFFNDVPGRFTNAYGARPEEIAPFFALHGFTMLSLFACEGISVGLGPALAELAESDPAVYTAALDAIFRTSTDPAILGTSNHLLYVGQLRDASGGPAV